MLRVGLLLVRNAANLSTNEATTVIRRALPSDRATIEALLTESGLPTAGVAETLDHFLVAERDGSTAGAIGLELYGEFALLRSAVISRASRGAGIGSRLVRELLQHADASELSALYLLTTTAEEYFPRFGFAPIARADVPVVVQQSVEFRGACPATAIVMRRTRPSAKV